MRPKHVIVDFHAETTSEKPALGCLLDGKVTVTEPTLLYNQNGVRILNVPGRSDVLKVEYHRFRVTIGGKQRIVTLAEGHALLSADAEVAPVVLSYLIPAEQIDGDEAFLLQSAANAGFAKPLNRLQNQPQVEDPPNPCRCWCCDPSNCTACTWSCVKQRYG